VQIDQGPSCTITGVGRADCSKRSPTLGRERKAAGPTGWDGHVEPPRLADRARGIRNQS
jgi:hypothetical protein